MRELKVFFRTRWIELLIAGVWLQSVVSAAFTGNLALLAITTLGGLALLFLIFSLVGRLQQHSPPSYGLSEAFEISRQALIFTVGRQKETILFALEAQRPVWLGLLCSRDSESIADEIIAIAGLDEEHVEKEIVDPWSVLEVRQKMAFVVDRLNRQGVRREQIAVDITGGTVIMSAAAFSVAAEQRIDSQYVRSEYDDQNRPIPKTKRGVFVTRYEGQIP